MHASNPSPGETEIGGPLEVIASQPRLLGELSLQASERPCLNYKTDSTRGRIPKIYLCGLYVCTHMCPCAPTHT